MKRKKFSVHKAFTVLLLTIIIFSMGILIGTQTTHKKFDTVLDLSKQLQIQTSSVEAEFDILKNNICLSDNVLFLTEDLFDLSEKLDYMENKVGSDNEKIKELKNQYFIIEAKHWLLAKERVESCFNNNITINNTIVLYFYSNEGDCPKCQQQGAVISYLHKEYEGMKVYSFDMNSQTPAVNVIKKIYGLDESVTPALIINDKVHQGYLNSDEFIGLINTQIKAKNSKINSTINQTVNDRKINSTN